MYRPFFRQNRALGLGLGEGHFLCSGSLPGNERTEQTKGGSTLLQGNTKGLLQIGMTHRRHAGTGSRELRLSEIRNSIFAKRLARQSWSIATMRTSYRGRRRGAAPKRRRRICPTLWRKCCRRRRQSIRAQGSSSSLSISQRAASQRFVLGVGF